MAHIHGTISGYVPVEVAPQKAPKPKRKASIFTCHVCKGETKNRKKIRQDEFSDGDEKICRYCDAFFYGLDSFGLKGCTDASPEIARRRCEGALKTGWIMVLRRTTLGVSGITFTVEAGDMIPVEQTSPDPADDCSDARTRSLFMVTARLGPLTMRLYPHEFADIDLFTIIELKRDGEVEEQFVSADDTTGYFAPVPEIRQMIQNTFGCREAN